MYFRPGHPTQYYPRCGEKDLFLAFAFDAHQLLNSRLLASTNSTNPLVPQHFDLSSDAPEQQNLANQRPARGDERQVYFGM